MFDPRSPEVIHSAEEFCDDRIQMASYDEAKLTELILYVAEKLLPDPRGGAVKLNKVLWWAECGAIRSTGRPLTGAEFQKLANGPAPRRLVPIRAALIEAGDAELEHRDYMGHRQSRIVPKRQADTTLFAPHELALVDQVVEALWHKTASEVSDASHREIGWRMAEPEETIPVVSAFLSDEVIVTPAMVERATELARRHGLS